MRGSGAYKTSFSETFSNIIWVNGGWAVHLVATGLLFFRGSIRPVQGLLPSRLARRAAKGQDSSRQLPLHRRIS